MIPLRDVIPSRTTPWATYTLIGINAIVFLNELRMSERQLIGLFFRYGIIPQAFTWTSLITSMFVHGGWAHVLGNLLCLWIFGDNVEDRFGHIRFIVFYLLVGVVAGYAQALATPESALPVVGASGAIAGVMGAYFILFPYSRIHVLVFLLFFIDIIEIPALFFLGFWFVLQLLGGVGELTIGAVGSTALWAHAAGFVFGVLAVRIFRRPERQRVDWWT